MILDIDHVGIAVDDLEAAVERYRSTLGLEPSHRERVEDVAASLSRLRDEGITPIDQVPRRGSRDTLIAFVHPKDMEGVLVELVQVA